MSNLSVFDFRGQQVRIVSIDGEPWFVGADVCRILDITNTGNAYSRLKTYEKTIHTVDGVDNPNSVCISEPGLYRLVLTSRKPQAEPFQDWVCQEVLPAIRKKGAYSIKDEKWQKTRIDGKKARRKLTDAIADYIKRHPELSPSEIKFMYPSATNALYLKTHGARAQKLIELLGCNKDKLRDSLTDEELCVIHSIEDIATRLIDVYDMNPIEALRNAVERALAEGLFTDKYLKA